MKNKNRWTRKRMNKTCSQPRIMCQSKLYLFTTGSYMSIRNTTSSSLKGMFPLKIETLWDCTFFIPFNLFFIWIQSFKPLMSKSILVTWRIKWMKKKQKKD